MVTKCVLTIKYSKFPFSNPAYHVSGHPQCMSVWRCQFDVVRLQITPDHSLLSENKLVISHMLLISHLNINIISLHMVINLYRQTNNIYLHTTMRLQPRLYINCCTKSWFSSVVVSKITVQYLILKSVNKNSTEYILSKP